MAQIRELAHHLRCLRCDGYGFVTIQFWTDRQQLGEQDCPVCSGSGTKRRERIVEVRPLGKLKDITKMTVGELDEHVRRFAVDGEVRISFTHFGLNVSDRYRSTYDGPSDTEWLGEADFQQAQKQGAGWTVSIHATEESHLRNDLDLAASSLPVLLQSLARFDLEPA